MVEARRVTVLGYQGISGAEIPFLTHLPPMTFRSQRKMESGPTAQANIIA